jgi:hypothetical protein
MKLKKLNPHSPEVIDAMVEMIRQMTPEEARAFLTYRTPGVEETDMTGMYSDGKSPKKAASAKRHVTSK